MAKLRTCIVCQTKYEYCPHCSAYYDITQTWRTTFCSENCRDIFTIANKFAGNSITAPDAKLKLSELDLKNIDKFPNGVKSNVSEILSYQIVEETEQETVLPVEQNTAETVPSTEQQIRYPKTKNIRNKRN